MSDIGKFFAGKNVFVTGVTGFVGKVLVEKLLRNCDAIGQVFVLVRTKRGEDPELRFKKLVEHDIFNKLRSTQPSQLQKLKFICGDITEIGLGISSTERKILVNEVDVVFHCAACVKFDLSLLDILKINVEGTHRLLVLATEMKQLKAFTFVSTAFSQSYQTTLDEKHYPTGLDLPSLLESIALGDSEEIEDLQKILHEKNHPSTYTMSKAIAEDLVISFQEKIPVSVVRPSIVSASYSEPEKGFVEGAQGMSGVVAPLLTGMNRFVLQKPDVSFHVIPVDFTANTTIAAAFKRATNPDAPTFYNSTTSSTNRIKYREYMSNINKLVGQCPPSKNVFWYPRNYVISNFFLFSLLFAVFQLIPAMMFDVVKALRGKKTFLTKILWKIYKVAVSFERFTTVQFDMSIDNTKKLFDGLTEDDQKKFMFDVDQIDWNDQVLNCMKGIRRHLLREKDETIPEAQKQLKKLFWIDFSVKLVLAIGCCYCLKTVCF